MRIILPLCSYVLLWRFFRSSGSEWRRAALQAAVVWAVLMTTITELLSMASLVTRGWLAAAWAAACLVEILCLARCSAGTAPVSVPRPILSAGDRTLLILAALLVVSTGVLAVLAPPNTWDAMEYHLPRVILWVSNHNVRFFPTPDYSQLIFGPASEYAMLHAYLLWGSDRLVNLVNFSYFIGTILVASLVAERLGAGLRGQAFAALFAATVPEGLLEASGPMNTAASAFWIGTAAYLVLVAAQEERLSASIFAALSVGMALLTKGTAYVYLPVALLACWWMGSSGARIRMLRRLPVLALVVLALNGPQFGRAYQLTGSPLGIPFPDGGPRLHWMCDHITPVSVVANVLRNVALHLNTPSNTVNERVDNTVRWVIRRIGQNPDDPNALGPGPPFSTNRRSLHEAYTGNPLHFAVLVIACLVVILAIRSLAANKTRWYVAGVLSAFVMFCGLLRWQIWDGRLHLPIFVLGAAVVGLVVERLLSNRSAVLLGSLLLLSAAPFVYSNKLRSFIPWNRVVDIYRPRNELYFADMHLPSAPAYEEMANEIRSTGCQDIAMKAYVPVPDSRIEHSPPSFFVYPLFGILHVNGQSLRIRYVDVENLSAKYARDDTVGPPCVLVCLDCQGHPATTMPYLRFNPQVVTIENSQVLMFGSGTRRPAQANVPSIGEVPAHQAREFRYRWKMPALRRAGYNWAILMKQTALASPATTAR